MGTLILEQRPLTPSAPGAPRGDRPRSGLHDAHPPSLDALLTRFAAETDPDALRAILRNAGLLPETR